MKTNIFYTEYERVTTAFCIDNSGIYTTCTSDTAKEDLKKHIESLPDAFIEHQRKPIEKIIGISVGCADTCNLACSYCYANAGTYNNPEQKIMKEEGYDKLYDYLLGFDNPINSINFFGGEPLLGFPYICKFIEKLDVAYKEKYGLLPKYSAVTNGTLITEEVAAFLHDHFDGITISIDGPGEICDMTRISRNPGESVYELICQSVANTKKCSKGERPYHLGASATLTPDTLEKILEYGIREFRKSFFEIGFDSVAFFPATGIDWSENGKKDLRTFFDGVIDETFEILTTGDTTRRPDGTTLGFIVDILKKHYNGDCVAGRNYFYFTADGELYPCQLYYNKRKNEVTASKRHTLNRCQDCPVINVCQSHCAGSALSENGSEDKPIDHLCESQRDAFESVLKRIGSIVYCRQENGLYDTFLKSVKSYAKENAASKRYGLY